MKILSRLFGEGCHVSGFADSPSNRGVNRPQVTYSEDDEEVEEPKAQQEGEPDPDIVAELVKTLDDVESIFEGIEHLVLHKTVVSTLPCLSLLYPVFEPQISHGPFQRSRKRTTLG